MRKALIATLLATVGSVAVAAPASARTAPNTQDKTENQQPADQQAGTSTSADDAQTGNTQTTDDTQDTTGSAATQSNGIVTPTLPRGPSTNIVPPVVTGSDIVVTAQRRQERVTDVPISVSVASAAQLERQQVNTVNDLSQIAPGLEIQQAPGQNTGGGGSIRGIGTQTFSEGATASVGIVVDGVSQGNVNISNLFDVARVEVLKGPQGTLFGLTTSAGVINITTNAPDPSHFSARVRTELSGSDFAGSKFGNQVVEGYVNVPTGRTSAVRVSAFGNLLQGPDRNLTTGKYVNNDNYGARGRFRWNPNDGAVTVNLIGDYSHTYNNTGGNFFTFIRAAGPGPALGGVFPDREGLTKRLASCGITARVGNRDFCTSDNYSAHVDTFGGSLEVDYDAGPLTLTSISAYRGNRNTGHGDPTRVFRADPVPLEVQTGPADRALDLFTQEFRVVTPENKPVELTAGVFYSHQREHRDPEPVYITISPAPGLRIPLPPTRGAFDTLTDESLAGYGQATVHVTRAFRLIGGLRVTSERLALDRINLGLVGNQAQSLQLSTNRFSYRAGAQYDLAHDTMVYATAARGYKGGQIATPALPLTPYVVQPEIPQDYEVGLKAKLFRGLVMDLNGFYTTIDGFQAQQCTSGSDGNISCVQRNVNGVRSRGAEINFFGNVSRDLSVNTGFIWAKATYPDNFLGTDGTNIGGTQLANAPEYKFTFSGQYEHDVTERLKGFVAINTEWKSRIRYEANSVDASTFRPHWLAGGRIGVKTQDDRYQVAVFVKNLFNVHEPELVQSSFPYIGPNGNRGANVGAIYGPNSFRQVGLSLDAKFR